MSATGLVVLAAGLAACSPRLKRERGIERVIALGRVFVAAPLATFGGLHLAAADGVSQVVPAWMPWRLFWTYLVGGALIATALSLISGRLVRSSSLLAGGMMLAFVAMIHLPGVAASPQDRIRWAVLFRDTGFSAGLLALGSSAGPQTSGWKRLAAACQIAFAITALFFAAEHLLHPEFAPGVPLAKMTPPWIPAPRLWGDTVGLGLLASGALLLVNRGAREAGAWLGAGETFVVLLIYVPMLAPIHGTAEAVEAINYVADTLLFAGTALIVAEASGRGERQMSTAVQRIA